MHVCMCMYYVDGSDVISASEGELYIHAVVHTYILTYRRAYSLLHVVDVCMYVHT